MNHHQHDQDLTDNDLRAGLTRLAAHAKTHHDPAADAMRRARSLRSRRRATTVVAGLAAIAVALPLGLNLLNPRGDHTRVDSTTTTPTPTQTHGPTPTHTPAPAVTPTAGASPEPTAGPVVPLYAPKELWSDKDFAGLPRGEDPKVPWYADGEIHDGATTTPVDLPDWTPFELVDEGYLANRTENEQWRLQLVGLDGTQKLTARGRAVVSNDGRQIAWATPEGTVNVADAHTGKILHSIHVGKGGPGGFLGKRVLLTVGPETPKSSEVQVWDPRTGQLTAWTDFADVQSTYRGLAAVVPKFAQGPVIDREDCSAVIDTDNGNRELWRVCPKQYGGVSIRGFSPNGRYAVVWIMNEGQTVPNYTIADARTGRPVLTILGYSGTMEWEDEEHFLLTSYSSLQGERGIVRCTVAGTCELATHGRPADSLSYKLPGDY
ncbi:hypothetical protein [Actinopolymorpha pittospori]|uniref:Uncharacterized protein n=1 Tax=Actinopolymorpha pittospori TaxID=648752 RepID=A0A927N5M0_9ACTN|nr:hypothetical protein [Actinopolymorpha pittospori]MBE1612569.1 hypothetical protein [Actinopolymorpha pittospori]